MEEKENKAEENVKRNPNCKCINCRCGKKINKIMDKNESE